MNERNGNRKRSRKRGGRGGDASAATGNKNAEAGRQKGSGGKRKRAKSPKIDPAVFWGDAAALPDLDVTVHPSSDVTAVLTSLGRPPVPGHETAAEHWFQLVYERSRVLAAALATAGGLDPATEADEPVETE